MRKKERLDPFYKQLKEIHRNYFPDWRFGQLIVNFLGECGDPFFWEEDDFIKEIKAWANKTSPWRRE